MTDGAGCMPHAIAVPHCVWWRNLEMHLKFLPPLRVRILTRIFNCFPSMEEWEIGTFGGHFALCGFLNN